MQLQNSFIRSIALTGLAIAGISGCAAGGLGMFPTGSPQGEATLGDAGGGLAGAVAQLRRIVAGDVVEDLYLSWQDRPYDRATIAVAMRTTRALAQDLALRQHDAGRIPSGQRQQALAWVQNAVSHLGQNKSQPPPDVSGIDWKRWLTETDTQKESPSAIFAFIDRTSIATQADSFGDFDLVVSTGQPIYPLAPRRGSIDLPSLAQYASSLDVGLVRLSGSGGAAGDGIELKSRTLREMMTQSGRLTKSTAVLDAPTGESWGAMLARRALFRGASGLANCNAIGILIPPGERTSLAARTRATMWVQALDGQRLGLVEGWRDLQDGQSRLADPDWLEAVA
ncbi:MAG: hypothetical protein GXP29_05645, partial [Planctomycetes bacterium]|nr:hypothetical protein [Planctomycetota bacterium]